jgi:hypothetical protein
MMGWMAPLRHLSAKLLSDRNSSEWEPSMGEVTTIGLDLAKRTLRPKPWRRRQKMTLMESWHEGTP